MKVVFSTRAYASVLAETTEKIKTETGGLFLGAYQDETWFVVESIDPGPKSIFEVAYFEYDQAYTQHLIRKIANLYACELRLIGLWHRHPGSFDVFSSTDDGTNSKYAQLNESGAISALVNIDPDFRITMYHVDRPCKYSKIKFEVGDELIPVELMKFKEPSTFVTLMKRLSAPENASAQANAGYHRSACFASFMKAIAPLLYDYQCKEIVSSPEMDEQSARDLMIDALMEDIAFFSEEAGIEITVLQREKLVVLAQEAIDGITRLYFAYSVKDERVIFEYNGKTYYYKVGLFKELFRKAILDKQHKPENTIMPPASEAIRGRTGIDSLLRLFTGGKNGGSRDEQH